jgi:hypothetical protein
MKKEQQTKPSIKSLNRIEANYQLFIKKGTMKNAKPVDLQAKAAKIPLKVSDQQKGELYELFDNPRYLTRGVAAEIPLNTAIILWHMIELRRQSGIELDYLQVFQLSDFKGLQKITHTQEVPPCREAALIKGSKPITTKVYVIDDGEYSTMLMAEEY